MPDARSTQQLNSDQGRRRAWGRRPELRGVPHDGSSAGVAGEKKSGVDEDSPGANDPGNEGFLAALEPIWDVPVEEIGMAVTFDARHHT